MKILEHMSHAMGRRVPLDTKLNITTFDTDSHVDPVRYDIGTVFTFTLAIAVEHTIADVVLESSDKMEAIRHAHSQARRFIGHELYSEITDRLHEIMMYEYEHNRSGDQSVAIMLNKLIGDLRS
jgi:hypothetical protein